MRFPGFTDEWKQTGLSSYTKKITKKNKGNSITNVLCNSANLGIIPQSEYFDRDIANSDNTDGYYVIESGDFVYNPRKSVTAPYGPVNMYTGIAPGIISPLYLCFTVNNISKEFLLNWFKGSSWHKYVYSHGDTGVRYDRVSIKDDIFLNMPISVPSLAEQEKISKLLTLIDERIATQNKIIEDLKKLKSAIIDKLYWEATGEEYHYSELFTVVTERNTNLLYSKVIAASQEYGMIERNYLNLKVQFDESSIHTYKIIHPGDYVIHLRSFQGGYAFSRLIGICSPAYVILRPHETVEYGYFEHYFTSTKFVNSLRLVTYGIRDGRSINVEEWLSMKVCLPSKKEQQQIIQTIKSFDDKLQNETVIYTALLKQRSYLLGQLFM